MYRSGLVGFAGLIAAATTLALGFVLFPERLSSSVAVVSLAIFAGSVGLLFYVPSIVVGQRGANDAAPLASIGPVAAILAVLLVTAATGFLLALGGFDRLAVAADVLAVGSFLVGVFVVRAALTVVEDVARRHSGLSRHAVWRGELLRLASTARDTTIRMDVERAAEDLQYAASDLDGSPQDAAITQAIEVTSRHVASGNQAMVRDGLAELRRLLSQREVYLRSSRSKA
jgi:hypothetical protein